MKQIKSFNSPNSKEWLSSLLSYFINIKSIDDNIESLRISLCSQNDFTPKQLFQYLDKKYKDILLLNDFVDFLNELQVPFEEKYLRKFIHNFDKDSDFSLNFKEFLGLITPKKSNDLKHKILSNMNNIGIVTNNTKNIFGKILCEELELVKNCIKTAKFCQGSLGFTCYESFVEIAGNDKYITEKHLYNFLQKNNINISNNDMHQLMFRLDADDDGRISFNEFEEIFFPTKEGDLNYKINNIQESYYTISSTRNQQSQQGFPKFDKNNNINNFTFGQSQNTVSDVNTSSNNLKEIINEDNMRHHSLSNIIKENNFSFKEANNKGNTYNNIMNFSKTQKKIKSYNKLPLLKDNELNNIEQVAYLTELNDIEKTFSSTFNKRLEHGKIASYKSPKIKHTQNPLHYDYSTYSNEDKDEYHRRQKHRESAKTDGNRNYRVNKNISTNTNNNIEIKNKKMTKLCCGCLMYDPLCPCQSNIEFSNCICPKKIRKNKEKVKSSYQKKFENKINNRSNGFKNSMNSQFSKTKSNFNFVYNNENENYINERKFDENRLLGYKQNNLF